MGEGKYGRGRGARDSGREMVLSEGSEESVSPHTYNKGVVIVRPVPLIWGLEYSSEWSVPHHAYNKEAIVARPVPLSSEA